MNGEWAIPVHAVPVIHGYISIYKENSHLFIQIWGK